MERAEIENLAKEIADKLVNREGVMELYQKYGSTELTEQELSLLYWILWNSQAFKQI